MEVHLQGAEFYYRPVSPFLEINASLYSILLRMWNIPKIQTRSCTGRPISYIYLNIVAVCEEQNADKLTFT